MSAALQPFLFHHERAPNAEPLRVRMAIDRLGFPMEAGGKTAHDFDRLYPSCAPHRIAEFLEVIP